MLKSGLNSAISSISFHRLYQVKRADLITVKGDHLTEDFDYDRQSNTVLIESPANITESSIAATIAVDLDRVSRFGLTWSSDFLVSIFTSIFTREKTHHPKGWACAFLTCVLKICHLLFKEEGGEDGLAVPRPTPKYMSIGGE